MMKYRDFEANLRQLGIKLPTGPSKSEAAQQLVACAQSMWKTITQHADGMSCDRYVAADCIVASMMQDSNQIVDHLRFSMASGTSDAMMDVSVCHVITNLSNADCVC